MWFYFNRDNCRAGNLNNINGRRNVLCCGIHAYRSEIRTARKPRYNSETNPGDFHTRN